MPALAGNYSARSLSKLTRPAAAASRRVEVSPRDSKWRWGEKTSEIFNRRPLRRRPRGLEAAAVLAVEREARLHLGMRRRA